MAKTTILLIGLGQRTVKKAIPALSELRNNIEIIGAVEPYPPKNIPEEIKNVPRR